ncbi:hypothetical protein B0H13DRAFT_2316074 [Mycena leptocephala]|nr:hypothetical protein B0H13DRAFT_2316074 [Mycena leptocephala]
MSMSRFGRRRIPGGALRDLRWWNRYLPDWKGIQSLHAHVPGVTIFTDASGSSSKGIGGHLGSRETPDDFFASPVPRRHRKKTILFKELWAVLHAPRCWATPTWAGGSLKRDTTTHLSMFTIRDTRHGLPPPPHGWAARVNQPDLVAFYLWHGLASSTRGVNDTACKSFERFVGRTYGNTILSPYPASGAHLLAWVASLPPVVSGKSIKRYVGALKSFHGDLGYPSEQFTSRVLERVIRGIRRFHGDFERKEHLPITHPILEKIIAALNAPILPKGISKELAETLKSAYCLSFSGFFRYVIIQSEEYLTVDLPGSKTAAESPLMGYILLAALFPASTFYGETAAR